MERPIELSKRQNRAAEGAGTAKDLVVSWRRQRYIMQTQGALRYALRGKTSRVVAYADGCLELVVLVPTARVRAGDRALLAGRRSAGGAVTAAGSVGAKDHARLTLPLLGVRSAQTNELRARCPRRSLFIPSAATLGSVPGNRATPLSPPCRQISPLSCCQLAPDTPAAIVTLYRRAVNGFPRAPVPGSLRLSGV